MTRKDLPATAPCTISIFPTESGLVDISKLIADASGMLPSNFASLQILIQVSNSTNGKNRLEHVAHFTQPGNFTLWPSEDMTYDTLAHKLLKKTAASSLHLRVSV